MAKKTTGTVDPPAGHHTGDMVWYKPTAEDWEAELRAARAMGLVDLPREHTGEVLPMLLMGQRKSDDHGRQVFRGILFLEPLDDAMCVSLPTFSISRAVAKGPGADFERGTFVSY